MDSDQALPPVPSQPDMIQLMQQMISLQRENNELRRNIPTATHSSSSSVRKPDRPIVEQDSSDSDWALFLDSWGRYKDMCRLREISEIRNELRSSCSPGINKLLFELVGSEKLNTASEADLLAHIKSVAVKGLHPEVHRQTFHSMRQSEGEAITHYLARLRAQANFCNFSVQCPNTPTCPQKVSYAEDMISSQMIAGLVNNEHQTKVLAQAATLITLQQKFDLLISLETTDKSTQKLHPTAPPATTPPSSSTPQKSDYKQKGRNITPCTGCGKTYHPGKTLHRKNCPAFEHICEKCHTKGHFQDVCRKRVDTDTTPSSSKSAQSSLPNAPTSSILSQVSDHQPSKTTLKYVEDI